MRSPGVHGCGIRCRPSTRRTRRQDAGRGRSAATTGGVRTAAAPGLRQTGFHPIDGGLHLRAAGWPAAISDLVAHHSGSRFVAAVRQLDGELALFVHQDDPLTDALTVADQTAGPRGRPMTVEERIADMLGRHGPDSPNARAHRHRGPYLRAAARRVADRLEATGINPAEHSIF